MRVAPTYSPSGQVRGAREASLRRREVLPLTGSGMSLANAVLSYVPRLALRTLGADEADQHLPLARRFPAAILFADIAGSSALTERLAEHGSIGVEELSGLLNAYFSRLIGLV